MIYFDNAATTKVHPAVLAAMQQTEQTAFFNANTLYTGGVQAAKQIAQAKQVILDKINGTQGQLIFTAGATEANQLIMQAKIKRANHHLIITAGDHNSVYHVAKSLQTNLNCPVDQAPLQTNGLIDLAKTVALINDQTRLLVVSVVNSDTGTWQDVAALVQAVRARSPRIHIHADAAQALGKVPLDVVALGVDSLTLCAHKIHGPKGIGALWLRAGVDIGERHGTLNNAGIVGFAKAVEVFHCPQVPTLHDYLVTHLPAGCRVNGINNNPYITNILLPQVFGETVLNALNQQDIYVGLGSACAAHSQTNRTLAAMQFTPQQQKQVLRISFGMDNTLSEVKTFLAALQTVLSTISGHNIA